MAMHSWRWSGLLVLVAMGVALVWARRGSLVGDVEAGGLELVGYIEAPDRAFERYLARCIAVRFEAKSSTHHSDIDTTGRFAFSGLESGDYRVEVVLRDDPEVTVAYRDFVRPAGEELVLVVEPLGRPSSAD
jgi:hypothetical protein